MNMISALIVNCNGRRHLPRCLDSLRRQPVDLEVLLVDNGSTDGSVELVKRDFPEVRTLALGENLGFGTANNRGAARSQGDRLLLLNSDAWLDDGALVLLDAALDADPALALVAPQLHYPGGRLQQTWAPPMGILGEAVQLPRNWLESRSWTHGWLARLLGRLLGPGSYTAACMLLRRRAFDQVSGFDERFFLHFEDVDLCQRLHSRGWRSRLIRQAKAYHLRNGSGGSDQEIVYRQGQLRYYRKHRPVWEERLLRLWLGTRFQRVPDARLRSQLLSLLRPPEKRSGESRSTRKSRERIPERPILLSRPKLTALVATHHRDADIRACLETLRWCDEVLVVDSHANDETREIVGAHPGARLIEASYSGSDAKRNWAMDQATGDWILIFGADQRCPPALRKEIEKVLIRGPKHSAYRILRHVFFLNRRIRYSGLQHDQLPRMIEQGHSHESSRRGRGAATLSKAPRLRHSLEHYCVQDLHELFQRITEYGYQGAARRWRDGRRARLHDALRPAWRFLRTYIVQLGFLDGLAGFLFCTVQAYGTFVEWSILWTWGQTERNGGRPELPEIEDDVSNGSVLPEASWAVLEGPFGSGSLR